MEDKEIVHIVLRMGVIQCKADTLDDNQMNQLDIDLMDQVVQYPLVKNHVKFQLRTWVKTMD